MHETVLAALILGLLGYACLVEPTFVALKT